jgi:hypothetical protein
MVNGSYSFIQNLLTDRLADEATLDWSRAIWTQGVTVDDLLEPTQYFLQFADALQPIGELQHVADDPTFY